MKRPFFDFLRKSLLFLFYIFLFIDIVHAQDGHSSLVDSIVMLHHDHVNDINENVGVMVMDVDTIRDDVSSIHDEVKTLTTGVNTYFNDNVGCCNWNMIGAIGSILSIIAMIIVYCFTRKLTNEQIIAQADNTKEHIDVQRRLSSEQIKAMQEQSLSRIKSLGKMGLMIKKHTGDIQKSVKHFEDKYLANNDKTIVRNALYDMKELYDHICDKLNDDYDHFDSEAKNEGVNTEFYKNSCMKIMRLTKEIQEALDKYKDDIQMPDENPYLDALAAVVFKPNLLEMYEQKKELKQKGEAYHNDVELVISSLFNV